MPRSILFPPPPSHSSINLVSRGKETGVSSSVPSGIPRRRISLNIHTAKKVARDVLPAKSRALFSFFLFRQPVAYEPRCYSFLFFFFFPPVDTRSTDCWMTFHFSPNIQNSKPREWRRVPRSGTNHRQNCFSLSRLMPSFGGTRNRGGTSPGKHSPSLMVIFFVVVRPFSPHDRLPRGPHAGRVSTLVLFPLISPR